MVRVLDEDPDLGGYLDGPALAAASAAAVAPLLHVSPGPVALLIDEPATHEHLGLLVLHGVIARHVSFGQIGAIEFLGPGDVFRPWPQLVGTRESMDIRWEALAPVRLAALDADFAHRVRPWPQIHSALLERAGRRPDALALQAALRQASSVEDRVLLALWHFAGAWGHVTPDGRSVQLTNITGEVLARFVGARRQSVSTALGRLADSGRISRRPDRSVLVLEQPSELERIQPGRRATDRQPRIRRRA
jgi:CRP/FNR family transcriptional regulator, cyclic AMP receptor protein